MKETESLKPMEPHGVTLKERKKATLTGVTDVTSFSDEEVVLKIGGGEVILSGEGLHIEQLNLQEGSLNVEGKLTALEYADVPEKRKGGLMSRFFR